MIIYLTFCVGTDRLAHFVLTTFTSHLLRDCYLKMFWEGAITLQFIMQNQEI